MIEEQEEAARCEKSQSLEMDFVDSAKPSPIASHHTSFHSQQGIMRAIIINPRHRKEASRAQRPAHNARALQMGR